MNVANALHIMHANLIYGLFLGLRDAERHEPSTVFGRTRRSAFHYALFVAGYRLGAWLSRGLLPLANVPAAELPTTQTRMRRYGGGFAAVATLAFVLLTAGAAAAQSGSIATTFGDPAGAPDSVTNCSIYASETYASGAQPAQQQLTYTIYTNPSWMTPAVVQVTLIYADGRALNAFFPVTNGIVTATTTQALYTVDITSARCAVAYATTSQDHLYVAPWLPLTFPQTWKSGASQNVVPLQHP